MYYFYKRKLYLVVSVIYFSFFCVEWLLSHRCRVLFDFLGDIGISHCPALLLEIADIRIRGGKCVWIRIEAFFVQIWCILDF